MKSRSGASRKSRHKKEYWRKGAQVHQLEEELAQKQQDRTGTHITSKKNEDLFEIAKRPNVQLKRKLKKETLGKDFVDNLKCFQNLKPDPFGPAPRKPGARKFPDQKLGKRSKLARKTVKKESLPSEPVDANFYDIWNSEEKSIGLAPDLEDFYLRQTRKKGAKIPKTRDLIRTTLPAVEIPHPGASYNPSFLDHQELLAAVAEKEKQKLQKETNLENRLKVDPAERATEESRSEELSQGLVPEVEVKEEEEEGEKLEKKPIDPSNRKLKAQRRRDALMKKEAKERKEDKEAKRRSHDIYRLRSLKGEIEAKEKKTKEKMAKSQERKEGKLGGPAKLSRYPFREPEPEFQLGEELAPSVRLLKPEGSVLEERFKSLQKRNILEARQQQKKSRKYKLKTYERRDFRGVTADYVPR